MSEAKLGRAAVDELRRRGLEPPQVALVLGSGMAEFSSALAGTVALALAEVPNWPAPAIEGHGGQLVFGRIGSTEVACLTGRVHLYEGWQPVEVVRAVRTLRLLGTPRFVLTNAAGGIDPAFSPGDLMVIRDHLNLTGRSALVGPSEPEFGPRFPDQSQVYDRGLAALLHDLDGDLCTGVYAGLLGPSYETPAEIRMLVAAGADAVGMSTVLEATALSAMAARVVGVSLISNAAAGISDAPLNHDEVIAAGRQAQPRLTRLLARFCERIGENN